MVQGTTVADLFALAIAAETSAAEFYRGLAAKFSEYGDVAEFWQRYVTDEISHARRLARLQGNLSVEQLAARADDEVQTLEDAYELVNDLENSETNAVFEFLISSFPTDPDVLSFLRTQLTDHVDRLVTAFPERFRDPGARLAAVVQAEEAN
jgi:hypothetical protein